MLTLLSLWVLSTASFPTPLAVGEDPKGNISFQPNVIPNLTITEMGDKSFHFKWYHNYFNLKLYINSETSLDSFGVSSKCAITSITKREISHVEFGYNITNIPIEISENVEYLLWKIEGASFNVSEIELEEIEVFEEGYNITRFHLPDNLVLSYEDLWLYDFTVSHPSKTETIVKGVKGKSSWNLDPITYSGGIMTMTEFGSPGSWADDLFWEFWNASYSNNWNVSEKTDWGENTQFTFGCRLKVGNGTEAGRCYVYDTDVQVAFNSTALSGNNQKLIEVTDYSHMRLGVLLDETTKSGSRGVAIKTLDTYLYSVLIYGGATSDVQLYGSWFSSVAKTTSSKAISLYGNPARIWQCNLMGVNIQARANLDVYDLTSMQPYFGIYYGTVGGTYNNIRLYDAYIGFYFYSNFAFHPKKVTSRLTDYLVYAYSIIIDINMINVDADVWNFIWGGTSTAEIYRQYTFDLTVTTASNVPIEDANVTLTYYGEGGGTHGTWLTDANGEIPEQTVTAGFYNQTGGDTIYTYNPYEITITKAGYLTYQRNFTQLEAKSWNIALLTDSGYNWFAVTIIIALFACFMTVYALTGKT